MITRNEYIRHRLLELSKLLKFQTFELFFPNPVNNTIEREFFLIRPRHDIEHHIHWNSMYRILEPGTKVLGKNQIINTYPGDDFSLTKEAFQAMEMIIVNDFNEVDVSEYSYSHKAAYEEEYGDSLISNGERPRLKSNIIVPIVERKSHGILTVMNKYKEDSGELLFDEITDEDVENLMNFAADLSRDLTFKFGFRKTLIPSIELDEKENELYETIKKDTDVIGNSVGFLNILKRIAQVCFTNDPVLLLGTTGVGKTYFAKLIFKYWQSEPSVKIKSKWDTGRLDVKLQKVKVGGKERVRKQFRNINIAAIPDTLFEAEIFGSVKGAATDIKGRFGILVEENGNPLIVLFDEIGDLSANNQAKLLKCIEEQEISLVGSNVMIPLDNARIIAATNRQELLYGDPENRLRQDLIYRFKNIMYIPPLTLRKEDIEPLVYYIVKKHHRNVSFDQTSLNILHSYDYPGNIRELESIISFTISRLKQNEKVVNYFHLPRKIIEGAEYEGICIEKKEVRMESYSPLKELSDGKTSLTDLKSEYEIKRKELVEFYYTSSDRNIAKTARITGLSEAHVRRLLRQ